MGFSAIIGQDRAVRRLLNAVGSDRLAHALLFVGPTGTGRRTTALALAERLFCQTPEAEDACGQCAGCRRLLSGRHPDLIELWPTVRLSAPKEDARVYTLRDAQGVNHALVDVKDEALAREFPGTRQIRQAQVQELIRRLGFRPVEGEGRVVIINRAELMGVEAANAFLKTLEEPPRGTTIVLTAPDSGQVLSTIRSRCQRVPFALASDAVVADVVRERLGLDRTEAERVAALAGGRIGRALQLDLSRLGEMDQALDRVLGGPLDRQTAFELSGELGSDRESARVFLDGLAQRLRHRADSSDMTTRRAAVRSFEKVLAARRDLERQANTRLVLDVLLVGLEGRPS